MNITFTRHGFTRYAIIQTDRRDLRIRLDRPDDLDALKLAAQQARTEADRLTRRADLIEQAAATLEAQP